jgi:hypothetical protein
MPRSNRYHLASDCRSVADTFTGITWSARQIMDLVFDRQPQPHPPLELPMSRDELSAALRQAADEEPWHDLVDNYHLTH